MKRAPSTIIEYGGKSQSLQKWADELSCPVQTLLGRLSRNWPIKKALTTKPGTKGGNNRGQKMAVEVLTPEELTAVLEHCNNGETGARNRALIVMGWRCGLRISEAIALRPKDFDERQQVVRVLHGKGNKSRTVGIDQQAIEVLTKWMAIRAAKQFSNDTPIFCTLNGGTLSDRYVRELMPSLANKAGIAKRVHFHALRHTMAFELASEGVPMHLIQQQLGHSNLAITSRYISHLNPSETINAMKGRSWGERPIVQVPNVVASTINDPDWLNRLRSDIGERLVLCHDARTNPNEFKAVVLLF